MTDRIRPDQECRFDLIETTGRARGFTAVRIILLLLAITLPNRGFAQESKVIVLENADVAAGKIIDGQDVREFTGNVRLRQEKVRIQCDRAVQFMSSGRVDMTGHVVISDDSVTIRTPRGVYYRDERKTEGFDSVRLEDRTTILTARYGQYLIDPRIAIFRGNVTVRDSASRVTADSLTYYRTDRTSVALGRVTVYNDADNVTITGGRLDHDANRSYSRMTRNPLLMQIDTSTTTVDTLMVRARVLEAVRDSTRKLIATDSVRILRADLAAVCGHAVFFTAADSIALRTEPVIWYQETQVSGDSITILLKKRALHRVLVGGAAFAISRSDSLFPGRYDQITGDWLAMEFAVKKLRTIDVVTHAISVYHVYEDSLGNGLNRTSGDRIIMKFDGGRLETIHVYGGVEGQYFPENMVRAKEEEYRIPGFLLRSSRPRRDQMFTPPGHHQQRLPVSR
jgi:lipopolysaccharide export system protein LptA